MPTAPLHQAVQVARTVMAQVGPDQFDLPTPCASWTVSSLIAHMIGSHGYFTAAMTGTTPPEGGPVLAGHELVEAFQAASAETLAEFDADGAMDRTVTVPFGTFPATVFIGFATNDTFTHAWDLACALGLDTDLTPDFNGPRVRDGVL